MKKIRKDNVVLRVADDEVNAYLQKGYVEVKANEKKEEKKPLEPAKKDEKKEEKKEEK